MNPILEYVKGFIGKPLSGVPSEFTLWLNGTLRQAEIGMLEMDFLVRKDMTNPMGIMHGGVMAAIMDEMMGFTVFCMQNEYFYSSVNLSVDFLESGKVGDTVTARAQLIRKGSRFVNMECTLKNQKGVLIAKASSNLATVPVKVPDYQPPR